MFGDTSAEPRLWKGYVAVAPFLALLVWGFSAIYPSQRILIVICGLVAWPFLAYGVHMRVRDDWRMNYGIIADPYAQTTPLSEISEKPRD